MMTYLLQNWGPEKNIEHFTYKNKEMCNETTYNNILQRSNEVNASNFRQKYDF